MGLPPTGRAEEPQVNHSRNGGSLRIGTAEASCANARKIIERIIPVLASYIGMI